MNIRDPSSSPHGAIFMPSLPVSLTELVDEPFSPSLGAEFEDYALNSSNRSALTVWLVAGEPNQGATPIFIIQRPTILIAENAGDYILLKTGQNYTLNYRMLKSTARLRPFMDSVILHDMLYVYIIQEI